LDTEKATETVDTQRLMEMIPHRYPFLMIDRLIDFEPGVSATGVKNVSINEPHFQGHFPGHAVMPGVLIIEAMAQTSAALVIGTLGPDAEGKLVYFMSIENARFRKPVTPGDTLYVHVHKRVSRGNVWKFSSEAKVDGTVVAEATYSAMILDN
jgi:3-hydroxyacyl-[acyl-carrier-protein] dehydratase